ncbi:unnamed protein product [Brachionus calyciflorus]|uniref:Uncharacterized protein n=1 Tax=Brachionus calyciflorus TaxID=104777 RepID=A0A813VQ79_9BILA|nr:unnamed protein product [Brachionus calyciflorus]
MENNIFDKLNDQNNYPPEFFYSKMKYNPFNFGSLHPPQRPFATQIPPYPIAAPPLPIPPPGPPLTSPLNPFVSAHFQPPSSKTQLPNQAIQVTAGHFPPELPAPFSSDDYSLARPSLSPPPALLSSASLQSPRFNSSYRHNSITPFIRTTLPPSPPQKTLTPLETPLYPFEGIHLPPSLQKPLPTPSHYPFSITRPPPPSAFSASTALQPPRFNSSYLPNYNTQNLNNFSTGNNFDESSNWPRSLPNFTHNYFKSGFPKEIYDNDFSNFTNNKNDLKTNQNILVSSREVTNNKANVTLNENDFQSSSGIFLIEKNSVSLTSSEISSNNKEENKQKDEKETKKEKTKEKKDEKKSRNVIVIVPVCCIFVVFLVIGTGVGIPLSSILNNNIINNNNTNINTNINQNNINNNVVADMAVQIIQANVPISLTIDTLTTTLLTNIITNETTTSTITSTTSTKTSITSTTVNSTFTLENSTTTTPEKIQNGNNMGK